MTEVVQYLKVTNRTEKHYDHQYKDGLNTLNKPFCGEAVASDPGGLYFTTKEFVHKFYRFGCWLRIVSLPKKIGFKMIKDPEGVSWRSNMINLEKKYPLYSVATIKLFDLRINDDYVYLACSYGDVELMKYLFDDHRKQMKMMDKRSLIEYAVCGNNIPVAQYIIDNHPTAGARIFLPVVIKSLVVNKDKEMMEWLVERELVKKEDMNFLSRKFGKNSEFTGFIESLLFADSD